MLHFQYFHSEQAYPDDLVSLGENSVGSQAGLVWQAAGLGKNLWDNYLQELIRQESLKYLHIVAQGKVLAVQGPIFP